MNDRLIAVKTFEEIYLGEHEMELFGTIDIGGGQNATVSVRFIIEIIPPAESTNEAPLFGENHGFGDLPASLTMYTDEVFYL